METQTLNYPTKEELYLLQRKKIEDDSLDYNLKTKILNRLNIKFDVIDEKITVNLDNLSELQKMLFKLLCLDSSVFRKQLFAEHGIIAIQENEFKIDKIFVSLL